jgi:hypothetical protein
MQGDKIMAMIQDNWSINVAQANGTDFRGYPRFVHFCRIELGSLLPDAATEKWNMIVEKFPAAEGWHLHLDKVDCRSHTVATSGGNK